MFVLRFILFDFFSLYGLRLIILDGLAGSNSLRICCWCYLSWCSTCGLLINILLILLLLRNSIIIWLVNLPANLLLIFCLLSLSPRSICSCGCSSCGSSISSRRWLLLNFFLLFSCLLLLLIGCRLLLLLLNSLLLGASWCCSLGLRLLCLRLSSSSSYCGVSILITSLLLGLRLRSLISRSCGRCNICFCCIALGLISCSSRLSPSCLSLLLLSLTLSIHILFVLYIR